jgi:hypothetical protein
VNISSFEKGGRALEEGGRFRDGENFIMNNFLIYILHRILLGLLNQAACRITGQVRYVHTGLLREREG